MKPLRVCVINPAARVAGAVAGVVEAVAGGCAAVTLQVGSADPAAEVTPSAAAAAS